MSTLAPFSHPKQQFDDLLQAFHAHFPPDVAAEVEAFVYHMRDQKFGKIEEIMKSRMAKMDKLTAANHPGMDRRQRVIRFIETANPSDLVQELQKTLELDELFAEHMRFIEALAAREHGKGFASYQLDPQLRRFIQSGVVATAAKTKASLEQYAQAIRVFADLLQSIKSSVGEKAFLKMGASIVGGMAGGLFGSIAAREIVSSLMSDEDRIVRATTLIMQKWVQYTDDFVDLVDEFEHSYVHIAATLFGGTIMQFDKELRKAGLYIDQLFMVDYDFTISFEEQRRLKIVKWAGQTAGRIQQLVRERNTDKALEASLQFYRTVHSDSLLREVQYTERHNLIYVANIHRYAALAMKAFELEAKDELSFLAVIADVYKQMPYMVHDRDLVDIGALTQTDVLLEWIRVSLKHGRLDDLKVLLDYGAAMLERNANVQFYNGEQGYEHTPLDLETILYMVTHFLKDQGGNGHQLEQLFTDAKYFPATASLKTLKTKYSAAYMRKDSFYTFVKRVIRLTSFLAVFKPLLRKFRR